MKKKHAIGEGTVIGKGTVVHGSITSDATMIRVDGTVESDITTQGVLTVGSEGCVNGNVVAESLILGGSVFGNVKVNDKVEILSKGKLIGDIETKGITIDDDAVFQGSCKMEIVQEPAKEENVSAKEQPEEVKEEENSQSSETDENDSDKKKKNK